MIKQTKSTKKSEVQRAWHLIDVKDKILGRSASDIALLLMGKNKTNFVRNLDLGDYVVVLNAKFVKVTGKKETAKKYYRHSGFPGGFRMETLQELRGRRPTEIIRHAVSGMLPQNKLKASMLKRLYVFEEEEHNYKDKFIHSASLGKILKDKIEEIVPVVDASKLKEEKEIKMLNYIFTKGKRKEAVARIRLYKELKEVLMVGETTVKKGEIFVNGLPIDKYFSGIVAKAIYEEPFKITNTLGLYTITAKVDGGGNKSQLEAFIHGVSRALAGMDEKNRQILKKKDFLTRDSRIRQRRKVGMGGKSRRKKQSPKR